jgi:hypothetical protein
LTADLRLAHHPGMDRRRFLLTSLAECIAAPVAIEAQQSGKVRESGFYAPASRRNTSSRRFSMACVSSDTSMANTS